MIQDPGLEEVPAPKPVVPPVQYQGASPVSARPKLSLYNGPRGN
jgi:hypothetical protein